MVSCGVDGARVARVVPELDDLPRIIAVDAPDLGCPVCGRSDEYVLRIGKVTPLDIPNEVSIHDYTHSPSTCVYFALKEWALFPRF